MKTIALTLLTFLSLRFLSAQPAQTAVVRNLHDQPTLYVNGQPEFPFLYALTHVTGGRWSWEELPAHNLRLMAETGVRLYQVDLALEDLWRENKKQLDIDLARRQIRGVLDACPAAGVVVRLHVNAPFWWNKAHPEECVQFASGPVEALPEGPPFNYEDNDLVRSSRASLASLRWREEAGAKVREFCRRLARSREGRAVIGIHLAGGVYGEWHPWGFIKQEPDVSEPMQQYFRNWLKNKYLNDRQLQANWGDDRFTLRTATVPDTAERRCCADGFFRDPAREQRVIDYYHCQQAVIADDIGYFCRLVKQSWGRPLITGVFYGYIQFGLCRQAMNGHLEIQRLLDSPWIDYFAGPPSYYEPSRKAGGSGLQRAPLASIRLHGKLWFDEIDNGYLQDKRERDFVRSGALGDSTYLPVLQRSMWLPLMQGNGLWLYDFGPRRNAGWWDSPMYRGEIGRTIRYFRSRYGKPAESAADVLVVWDTESFYAVKNVYTKACEKGLDASAEALQDAGFSLDHVYQFDLPRLNLHRYQAVVFMNAWQLSPAQRRFIRDSVAQEGRTLIWNYGAGYSDGQQTAKEAIEDLTGIALQRGSYAAIPVWAFSTDTIRNAEPADPLFFASDTQSEILATLVGDGATVVARKAFPGHTMVWSGVPLLGKNVFRRLLADAGCHSWIDSPDCVYAADNLLLLHSVGGGKTQVQWKSGGVLNLTLPKIATRLLEVETERAVPFDGDAQGL